MKMRRYSLPRFASNAKNLRVSTGEAEVEHRFSIDARRADGFIDRIAAHDPVDVYDPASPVTYVRTIYFDTTERRLFHSTESAATARVRVRQYASAPDRYTAPVITDLCAFEVKVSHFGSRRKARLVDSPAEIDRLLYGDGWRHDPHLAEVRALRRAARAIAGDELRPVLTTYFRRVSHTVPGVRVTVDDGVTYAGPSSIARAGELAAADGVFTSGQEQVLEVKLSIQPPAWLAEAMRSLRAAEGVSKYHHGMLTAQRLEALASAAKLMQQPSPRFAAHRFSFEQEQTFA